MLPAAAGVHTLLTGFRSFDTPKHQPQTLTPGMKTRIVVAGFELSNAEGRSLCCSIFTGRITLENHAFPIRESSRPKPPTLSHPIQLHSTLGNNFGATVGFRSPRWLRTPRIGFSPTTTHMASLLNRRATRTRMQRLAGQYLSPQNPGHSRTTSYSNGYLFI